MSYILGESVIVGVNYSIIYKIYYIWQMFSFRYWEKENESNVESCKLNLCFRSLSGTDSFSKQWKLNKAKHVFAAMTLKMLDTPLCQMFTCTLNHHFYSLMKSKKNHRNSDSNCLLGV